MSETIEEIQVCYRHPDHKTLLRCSVCDRPICLDCAVSTSEGYLCPECIGKNNRKIRGGLNRVTLISAAVPALVGLLGAFFLFRTNLRDTLTGAIIGAVLGFLSGTFVNRRVGDSLNDELKRAAVLSGGIGAAGLFLKSSLNILKSIFLGQWGNIGRGAAVSGPGAVFIVIFCAVIWLTMKGIDPRKFTKTGGFRGFW